MELTEFPVTLRKLVPAEGKALKNLVTGEYIKDFIFLGKEEKQSNFIEVDLSEVPDETPSENSEEINTEE